MTHFLFEQTGRSPIVIPVVNVVGGGKPNSNGQNAQNQKTLAEQPSQPKQPSPEEMAAEQQRRFQELRAKLLGQEKKSN
jgi:hypothetical protein